MRKLLLCFLLCSAFVIACKKNNNTPGNNTNNSSNDTGQYYFRFTLQGQNYYFNSNYLPAYYDGGTQDGISGNQHSSLLATENDSQINLSLQWPPFYTIKDSDIYALTGKTIYFDPGVGDMHAYISYDTSGSSVVGTWGAITTSDSSYNITFTNVQFLKNDTTFGTPIETYIISGTCRAIMQHNGVGADTATLSQGKFHIEMGREVH